MTFFKYLFSFVIGLYCIDLFPQAILSGYVRNAETKTEVAGADVILGNTSTTTNNKGYFSFNRLQSGVYSLSVSALGFDVHQQTVEIKQGEPIVLEISLATKEIGIEEVVVFANRPENKISNAPGRQNMITAERLSLTAAQSADEYLSLLPGVQVSRSLGLFSHHSSVTMRGLSGNEQARVLVLVDGIPVNKSDGGSVNWNLISAGDIQRIEVVKGPGSAMYGGNAMGGVINVISGYPTKKLEGGASAMYGTYNTQGVKGNIGGRIAKNSTDFFFWSANASWRKSDGYIAHSDADRAINPFIVESRFNEKLVNLKGGFQSENKFQAEFDITYFDDMRTLGEKVYQPDGNTINHDSYQIRSTVKGGNEKLDWNIALFYLYERYDRVNEWFTDNYNWYNVRSHRTDYGLLATANRKWKSHTFISGIDIRNGSVDASDIYLTSTDLVDNYGKIGLYGIYFQDEVSLFNDNFKLLAGFRYDISQFYDGAFIVNHPSVNTDFMSEYQFSGMKTKTWGTLNPRLFFQYKPNDNWRAYIGYSRGFRPSVLDDLCRSGRHRGGFKVANANLKPEHLENYEIGGDYKPVEWAKIASSIYYSQGSDFLYYVSTGDSIDMGFGKRPIVIRTNIPKVQIAGAEFEFSLSPFRALNLFGSYAFNRSKIQDYKSITPSDTIDLTGNHLTDVPEHSFSLGTTLRTKFIDAGITARYVDEMYVNDQNIFDEIVQSNVYPATFSVDIRLNRSITKYANLSLIVQNIFNKQIYNSSGMVGPGRFITINLGVTL